MQANGGEGACLVKAVNHGASDCFACQILWSIENHAECGGHEIVGRDGELLGVTESAPEGVNEDARRIVNFEPRSQELGIGHPLGFYNGATKLFVSHGVAIVDSDLASAKWDKHLNFIHLISGFSDAQQARKLAKTVGTWQ